jgi:deoxyribonuclease-4
MQYFNIDKFGSHIKYKSNMYDTICSCISENMYSCQIFLGSNLTLKRSTCTDEDIAKTNELFEKWNINVYSHLPYCINLCGKNGNIAYLEDENSTKYAKDCVNSIQSEINTLSRLKCSNKGCVIHIGSIGKSNSEIDEEEKVKNGLNAVVQSINLLKLNKETPLCLETMVGRGGVLGKNSSQLKYIIDRVDNSEGLGICLDTCHLFAEGSYKLNKEEEIDKLFNDYYSTFGLDKIKVIHFNDSKEEFGSKKDLHSTIGNGYIWDNKNNTKLDKSCRYFIDRCLKDKISLVLETEPEDYEKVVKLYNK